MDANGLLNERDNPKALLVPGAVPLPIHNLVNLNDDSDSEDNLPSTIDFDALKVPGLPETSFQNVMSWRGGTPRLKIKQSLSDSSRKEPKSSFTSESAVTVSDVSKSPRQSPTVSEDSESDSDSSTESDSSSGSSSSASSESDSTSESDSSDKKVKGTRGTLHAKSPLSKKGTKDSVSNSSSSGRHKKRFTTTNYEPGSLKLRLSVFDQNGAKSSSKETKPNEPPSIQHPASSSQHSVSVSTPAPTSIAASPAGSKWKTARLTTNGVSSFSNPLDSKLSLTSSLVTPQVSADPAGTAGDAAKRITRQSQSTGSTVPASQSTESTVPASAHNGLMIFKGDECLNLPVGQTSQLTDSVTMTRVTAPRHSSPCLTVSPKGQGMSPGQGHRGRSPQHHLSDPVRYLAEKKSDLTISPIISPVIPDRNRWNSELPKSPAKVPFILQPHSNVNGSSSSHDLWPVTSSSLKPKFRSESLSIEISNGVKGQQLVAEQLAKFGSRLPSKLDVSIHPISSTPDTSKFRKNAGAASADEEEWIRSRHKLFEPVTIPPKGQRSTVDSKVNKSDRSNGKAKPGNRSKLSVFLPAAFKTNGKVNPEKTAEVSEGSNGTKGSKTRLKPRPLVGLYSNPEAKVKVKGQPYEGPRYAKSILQKRRDLARNLENGVSYLPTPKSAVAPPPIAKSAVAPPPISSGEVNILENAAITATPMGLRTKGAKKYIPEPKVLPVLEQFQKTKITKSPKKGKRSRSAERLANGERNRKRQKRESSVISKNVEALCDSMKSCSIGRLQPVLRRRKARTKSSSSPEDFSDSPGFIFEHKVFKNLVPPFPMTPPPTSPSRRDSSPSKPHVSRPSAGSAPSGRRKRSSVLTKGRSSSNLDDTGSPDLQKLPLKKRHGHGNQHYDGPSEDSAEESVFVFGLVSLSPVHIPPITMPSTPCFQPKSKMAPTFSDAMPSRKQKRKSEAAKNSIPASKNSLPPSKNSISASKNSVPACKNSVPASGGGIAREPTISPPKRGRPRKSQPMETKEPQNADPGPVPVEPEVSLNLSSGKRSSTRARKSVLLETKSTPVPAEEKEVKDDTKKSRSSNKKTFEEKVTDDSAGIPVDTEVAISKTKGSRLTSDEADVTADETKVKRSKSGSTKVSDEGRNVIEISPRRSRGRPKKSMEADLKADETKKTDAIELEPPPALLIVREKRSGVPWNEELVGDAVVIDSDCPLEFVDLPDLNGNLTRNNGTSQLPTLAPPPTNLQPITAQFTISPTNGKKKRKTNRTGFPTSRRKKKPIFIPAPNSGATELDSGQGQMLEGQRSNEVKVLSDDSETEDVSESGGSERVGWTSSTSASLTERVKMRRRNSMDSISNEERAEIAAGKVEVPGVIPAFMDVPNPPIILPHKNNYLQAGFLSSKYKRFEEKPSKVDESLPAIALEGMYGRPMSRDVLCPLPADTGLQFGPIIPTEPYQLPFDIWCFGVIRTRIAFEDWCTEEEGRRTENRKSTGKPTKQPRPVSAGVKRKRESMPEFPPDSWTFKKLKINSYWNKPSASTQENDDQLCECVDEELKCSSDDCLNRVIFAECPASCGEKCQNRRIQKHEWAPKLSRFMTEDKGYGVRSSVGISKGDYILEYVGEVVTAAEFKLRMTNLYVNDKHHYCLQLGGGLVIDGHRSGGEGRFVNHSCEPNCHMQKWSVNGLSRMALFALRDIPPGEELTYDYNFSLYNETEGQPCYCRSENCRGVIGGKSKISRRKNSSRLKGLAEGSLLFRGHLNSNAKVKVLSRKETKFAREANLFLVRNYEKIRRLRGGAGEEDERVSERVEKLMTAWVGRYRVGSNKNKPLVLTNEEPKVARVARMAQIFFELYKFVTSAKDTSGKTLCEIFMEVPMKRSFPVFHSLFEKSKLSGFKSIEKNILSGKYKSLQSLEEDVRLVLTSFALAYKTERPEAGALVERIKKIYKEAKNKAVQALEPFIVSSTSSPSNNTSEVPRLPPFLPPDPADQSDRVRCICGTYSDEGTMVQCEKCFVWQHCDCVGVVSDQPTPTKQNSHKKKRGAPKKAKFAGQEVISSRSSSEPASTSDAASISDAATSRSCSEGSEVNTRTGTVMFDLGSVGISDQLEIVSGLTEEEFEQMDTQVIGAEEPSQTVAIAEVPAQTGAFGNNLSESHYYCEQCDPREIDLEVKLKGQEVIPDRTYYLTLRREDGLVLRKNDTVYVLREWPPDKRMLPDGTPRPHQTYLTAGPLVKDECDIFRIDSLWKDDQGKRLVLGYNYLRPHETHHEPSRRFYPNEILKAPIHEVINIELIHGRCWVLDSATYCRGRPIGCIEEHLYICDLRVNKTANSFDKVGKRSQAVCMKSFAFHHFATRIKINRNVHPHGPPSPDFKMRPTIQFGGTSGNGRGKGSDKYKGKGVLTEYEQTQIARKRWSKRENLHCVVTGIEEKIPSFRDNPIDLSHLITLDKRSRKSKSYKMTN